MKDATAGRWEWLDLLLILFGPVTQLLVLAAAYSWGANWLHWVVWLVARWGLLLLQLAGVGLTVALLIWQRNSTNPPTAQRNFSSTFLFFTVALAVLLPWGGVLDWLRTEGRHGMEASLPAEALAEDCKGLVEEYGPKLPEAGGLIEVPKDAYPPSVAKLGGVKVWVDGDGVLIAQGGGPVLYGYRFFQEDENGDWVLVWFTKEFTGDKQERVATIKTQKPPLGEGD
jgi:hypothetical protein